MFFIMSLRACNHAQQSRALPNTGSPLIFDYKNSRDDKFYFYFISLVSLPNFIRHYALDIRNFFIFLL